MDSPDASAWLTPRLRLLQLIAGCLIAGAAAFFVIAIVLVQNQGPDAPPRDLGVLTVVAFVLGAADLVAWLYFPNFIVITQRRQIARGTYPEMPTAGVREFLAATGDAGRLFLVYQTRTIIAYGLLEGAAFLACIAYLVDGTVAALALAGFFLLLMILQFPLPQRLQQWLDEQSRLLADDRQHLPDVPTNPE